MGARGYLGAVALRTGRPAEAREGRGAVGADPPARGRDRFGLRVGGLASGAEPVRDGQQLVAQVTRPLMASGGVVGSRPGNDTAEPGAVVVGNGWEPTGSGGWDRGERGLGVIASGRPSAVEQLTEQHAQRVDVAAPVDRSSRELLGRTVAGRADDGARLCDRIAEGPRHRIDAAVGRDRARDPEVGDAHRAVYRNEYVARLDVAVDDAVVVRARERVGDLGAVACDRAARRANPRRRALRAGWGRRRAPTPGTRLRRLRSSRRRRRHSGD